MKPKKEETMKIFLTGEKQIGKSTCIQKFIDQNIVPVCGFLTKPLYEKDQRIGFYMHSLVEMERNDCRISIQHETYNEVIENIFNTFACEILDKSMQLKDHLLVLDEIGTMEKNEAKFIDRLYKAIEEHDNVLGVLKKKEAEHLTKIKQIKDVIVLNLDEISREAALEMIQRAWFESKGVGCVLLAAGNSSRFGSNKLLYELKGKRLVEIILDKLLQIPFHNVAVVSQYQPILKMAKERGFLSIENLNPNLGLSHSIILGVEKLKDCQQIMFVLADQPNLQVLTLRRLISESNHQNIICAEAKGIIQNPMIFPQCYYDELLHLSGDRGAKIIALSHTVKRIQIDEKECCDVDEQCDIEQFYRNNIF